LLYSLQGHPKFNLCVFSERGFGNFIKVGNIFFKMKGISKLEKNFKKFKKITKEEFLIAREITRRVRIGESQKILDVGCADGNLSKSLVKSSKNITFLDINEFDFSPQEKFIHSSFEKAKIKEKYDYILTSHVGAFLQK